MFSFFSSKNITCFIQFFTTKKIFTFDTKYKPTYQQGSAAACKPQANQIFTSCTVHTAAMTDARHYQSEYLVCLDEINYHFQTKFGNQRVGCLQQLSCYCIGTNQGGLELRCYQAILEHVTLLVQKIVLVFFSDCTWQISSCSVMTQMNFCK